MSPGVPWGTAGGFSSIIFHHTNAACLKLAESVPSGGQKSGDCHPHPFQLCTEKPDRTTANVNPKQSSTFTAIVMAGFLFFPHDWLSCSGPAFHFRAKL